MALVNLKSRLADYRGPVNYFPDESSGAQGFTENMTQTQFTGVAGQANNYTYNYPNLVSDGRLQAQKILPTPGQIANTSTPGAINQSNLPGIDNTALTFTYPSNVKDGRLWRPDAKSQVFPGGQNFIDDLRSGAKGFTLNVNESQFLGITNGTFTYPNSVLPIHKNSVQSVPTANSKFDQGTATLDNQLGVGSKFYYLKDGALSSKLFTQFGYATSKRYNDSVQSLKGQIEKSLLAQKSIEENSPSALTEQYKKFNLQDDSYNPAGFNFLPSNEANTLTSISGKQPFILRGIQRKDNPEPQRWGLPIVGSFDDGLIRGGASTAVERTAIDLKRISKWMASPKGLLWIVKQVGLGLSNPEVESTGGPLTRVTKIHTGVTALLSVAGNTVGLHFDKHGIALPWLNNVGNYQSVQRFKKWKQHFAGNVDRALEAPFRLGSQGNRLAHLRKELGLPAYTSTFVQQVKKGKVSVLDSGKKSEAGTIIRSISSLTGPGSVYGIGITTQYRSVDTRHSAIENAKKYGNFWSIYHIRTPYSPVTSAYGSTFKEEQSKTAEELRAEIVEFQTKMLALATNPVLLDPKTKKQKKARTAIVKRTEELLQHWEEENKANTVQQREQTKRSVLGQLEAQVTVDDTFTPGSDKDRLDSAQAHRKKNAIDNPRATGIHNYATVAYKRIPNRRDNTYIAKTGKPAQLPGGSIIDFRSHIRDDNNPPFFAQPTSKDTTFGDSTYYRENNLETKYGFGTQGHVGTGTDNSRGEQRGPLSFNIDASSKASTGNTYRLSDFGKPSNRHGLSNTIGFRGDRITAIDVVKKSEQLKDNEKINKSNIYPGNTRDLIAFYFEDGEGKKDDRKVVMPFRATITGLSDSFTPNWNNIAIMGRPDGAYLYTSFERQLSFTFTVAATSRAEMIPMWRKLNYLASYTMPDFTSAGGKPSGPFMRLTLGDMFNRCPGFLNSLTYTVPDEGSWDIADDVTTKFTLPKQLPTMIEVSVGYTVIHDNRPQQNGKVYYINDWLGDAETAANSDAIQEAGAYELLQLSPEEQAEIALFDAQVADLPVPAGGRADRGQTNNYLDYRYDDPLGPLPQ